MEKNFSLSNSKKLTYLNPINLGENNESFLNQEIGSFYLNEMGLEHIISQEKSPSFNHNDETKHLKKLDILELKTDKPDDENPEAPSLLKNNNNFLSQLFFVKHAASLFQIYFQVIKKKKNIILNHLRPLTKDQEIPQYHKKFSELISNERKKNNGIITEFQMMIIIIRIFKFSFLIAIILWGLNTSLLLVFSIFLSNIINSFQENDIFLAYMWGIALSAGIILQLFISNNAWNITCIINTKLRLMIVQILYSKILRLNNYCINSANIGKIINIIATDMNNIEFRLPFVIILMSTPFTLCLSIYILWSKLGPICLISIFVLALIYLIQKALSSANLTNVRQKNSFSDLRVKTCNELIEGIRLLKMYAWEMALKKIIDNLRSKEILKLLAYNTFILTDRAISNNVSAIVSLCLFYAFYMINENSESKLTPSLVFSVYQLLEYMRVQQVTFVGIGFSLGYELKIVMRRIIDILSIEEPHQINYDINNQELKDKNIMLQMKDFSAFWFIDSDKPVLKGLNISCEKGKIYAFIGKVGSGKSSLFYSILGEIPKSSGFLYSDRSIAYVEQEPFIITGSLINNIIFHRPFNKELYDKVKKACCLEKDIETLSDGENTEIGERGINLSGGQKARVSLARALYSEAELYLFDDPLSALDSKVGRKVFNKAIKYFLKDKCVMFVTHQIQYLKEVDYIYLFEEGKIQKEGKFDEFQHTLSSYFEENENKIENQNNADKSVSIIEIKNVVIKSNNHKKGQLYVSEANEEIEVTLQTYKDYLKFAKSTMLLTFSALFFFICEGNKFATSRILAQFGQQTIEIEFIFISLLLLVLSQIIFFLLKYYTFSKLILSCNKNLHYAMSESVVRAPVVFFDTNKTGVILNRFSNDLGLMDNMLTFTLVDFLDLTLAFFFGVAVAGAINPWFFIPIILIIFILYYVYKIGKPVILGLKKVDLYNKSPIFSFFTSTLGGISTINVYRKNEFFQEEYEKILSNAARSNFNFWEISRGFAILIEFMGKLATIIGIFITIWLSQYSPGIVGQLLLYLLVLSDNLNWGLRQSINADSVMNSVLRSISYCNIPHEDELIKTGETDINFPLKNEPINTKTINKTNVLQSKEEIIALEEVFKLENWPSEGVIEFQDVYMRYRPHLADVIKGLSVKINNGEKIGVVGRTGAGKSSLLQTLFRMFELSQGNILIDGINIRSLGLHTLRKRISIIPQSPFIFTGTIKRNLDPLELFSDDEIWNSLENVELKEYVKGLEKGIFTDMSNSSSVFSVGQRQLLCLARAILKKNKILVLDEATANVDLETDRIIQKKIKEIFYGCTIITIAHRLFTIADYDKVLVMENGKSVEFDAPFKLLTDEENKDEISKNGYFAEMVRNTGNQTALKILDVAKNSFFKII